MMIGMAALQNIRSAWDCVLGEVGEGDEVVIKRKRSLVRRDFAQDITDADTDSEESPVKGVGQDDESVPFLSPFNEEIPYDVHGRSKLIWRI